MSCKKCLNNISEDSIIICKYCNKIYHKNCEIILNNNNNWYCNDCINNNINDVIKWENCKICHYCRRINVNSLKCENENCGLYYCESCLNNEFRLSADYKSAINNEWRCLKCRNLCYCNFCLKERMNKSIYIL